MGDEQVRQPPFPAEREHQSEQLRTDRDVEHRHRFVGDDQLWPHHERASDDDALALPTGQLVREPRRVVLGRPKPRRVERSEHALASLGGRAEAIDLEWLGDEVIDRLFRIERLVRVLEDDLDAAAVIAQLRT